MELRITLHHVLQDLLKKWKKKARDKQLNWSNGVGQPKFLQTFPSKMLVLAMCFTLIWVKEHNQSKILKMYTFCSLVFDNQVLKKFIRTNMHSLKQPVRWTTHKAFVNISRQFLHLLCVFSGESGVWCVEAFNFFITTTFSILLGPFCVFPVDGQYHIILHGILWEQMYCLKWMAQYI